MSSRFLLPMLGERSKKINFKCKLIYCILIKYAHTHTHTHTMFLFCLIMHANWTTTWITFSLKFSLRLFALFIGLMQFEGPCLPSYAICLAASGDVILTTSKKIFKWYEVEALNTVKKKTSEFLVM